MNIYKSISELVGRTPLLELNGYSNKIGACARILGKLEYLNPAGSVKDRIAVAMIDDAEKKGLLKPGSVIIEPTSGNTGIGLAAVAASRGYRVILTMPDTMSIERRTLLAAYGAELVLTDGKRGMSAAIEKADELAASIDGAIIAGQFTNPANPSAHYNTTGPELWSDTDGSIDFFVAGVGSGGTLTGTGRYLHDCNPKLQVIAVEPADSPVISGGKAGAHGLQGIGAGFIPGNLDVSVIDKTMTVTTEQAYEAARILATSDGVLCGISSGAALYAAGLLARLPENRGKTIAVLLPDTGDRYLSTPLYSNI